MATTVREVPINGMNFRIREAGMSGEPVLLLHGFPETSRMWEQLMPKLAEAGYRCIAPDQRGYSPNARPEGVEPYKTENLVADAFAIADACGFGAKFHLVAHDWGAGVGWRMVKAHPERIASYTSMSIPHPASYGRAFRDDPDQQQRSQYIIFFQQPGAAEEMMLANDGAMLSTIWDKHTKEEVAELIAHFKAPGALTAAINWYRAAFGLQGGQDIEDEFTVTVPTLLIWGNQDQAVGPATVKTHDQYMKGPNKFVELTAGHWLVQEKFEDVLRETVAQLKGFPLK
ncbi:MAG: alpha/beta fold hydrolase [Dehalococcoidia bacterium]